MDKFCEAIGAFSNDISGSAKNGYLLIGVNDNGTLSGLKVDDSLFLKIDLKTTKLSHQDIGQMDMYRRLFDDLHKVEGDNPTIGIILCAEKSETVLKYSVINDNSQLFASKFMTLL